MNFRSDDELLQVHGNGDFTLRNGRCSAKAALPRASTADQRGAVNISDFETTLNGIGQCKGVRVSMPNINREMEVVQLNQSAVAMRIKDGLSSDKLYLLEVEYQLGGSEQQSDKTPSCCSLGTNEEDSSKATNMFINGWQSWSFCGSIDSKGNIPKPGTPRISYKGFHDGSYRRAVTRRSGRRSSEMFSLISAHVGSGAIFAGFLSQVEYYGAIETHKLHQKLSIIVRVDKAPAKWTDWVVIMLFEELPSNPLDEYAAWVASMNAVKSSVDIPAGWCSWYHYYAKISQDIISENVAKIATLRRELPLRVIQIDDGWQKNWGDWEPNSSFPEGMEMVAKQIAEAGFLPGLWMAPFAADKGSSLVKERPKWCLRSRSGRVANSGNCGKWFVGLDISNDEVVAHAAEQIRKAVAWGFRYLKLDFLYAGILRDAVRHSSSLSRASSLRRALLAIREAAGPDVFLVGCGCPLGSGIGIFDAMRISCDVGPKWLPDIPWDKWNLPSVQTALRNAITRSWMHQRWWINDPDCVLLRTTTSLTEDELKTVTTVVFLCGGMFMLSDALAEIPKERLRFAKIIWPPIQGAGAISVPSLMKEQVPSMISTKVENKAGISYLYAVFNWETVKVTRSVEFSNISAGNSYHCFEFWTSEYSRLAPTNLSINADIPAHGVRLFVLRVAEDSTPEYVGSNLHLSCGQEVSEIEASSTGINIELNVQQDTSGDVFIWTPSNSLSASGTAAVEGRPAVKIRENLWRVPVTIRAEGSKLVTL